MWYASIHCRCARSQIWDGFNTLLRPVHWFYSFGLFVSRCRFWRVRDNTLLGKARMRRLPEVGIWRQVHRDTDHSALNLASCKIRARLNLLTEWYKQEGIRSLLFSRLVTRRYWRGTQRTKTTGKGMSRWDYLQLFPHFHFLPFSSCRTLMRLASSPLVFPAFSFPKHLLRLHSIYEWLHYTVSPCVPSLVPSSR